MVRYLHVVTKKVSGTNNLRLMVSRVRLAFWNRDSLPRPDRFSTARDGMASAHRNGWVIQG